ncbi:hypothetical protein LUZ60_005387 [Juncus effusus]|nr:hypothetical protein LUZ60_005387 [Juncus effusus]
MAIALSSRCNAPSIILCFFLLCLSLSQTNAFSSFSSSTQQDNCQELHALPDSQSKCNYLKTHDSISCIPKGYINYLKIFYCEFGDNRAFLGYFLSFLWLLVLFYLLGNTASHYFCSSLESLSKVLKLSPAMAGVTLLSLGNGAPDVFSSIVSFMAGPGVGEVGLSSVLGGALFITTVVVGVICFSVGPRVVATDRKSFIRDVVILILVLCSLLTILIRGKISIWGAVSFLSIYVGYVLIVCTSHFCGEAINGDLEAPLLENSQIEEDPVEIVIKEAVEGDRIGFFSKCFMPNSRIRRNLRWILFVLGLPLSLPRKLTIPDISEERWSKPTAVLSVIFAPILLSTIWNSLDSKMNSEGKTSIYILGAIVGITLGAIALKSTEMANPPRKFPLPWLAGGFIMSVIWTYMNARELVALLVSFGHMIGINPSILGLTILAWGNSLGDLIADVAIATNGGRDGVQIAVSGCYASPLFNMVVGLGISLVFASWKEYPNSYEITTDYSMFETLIFLILGLIWVLLVLPKRGMKLDRVLGYGLLAIYLCFLILRIFEVFHSDM